MNRKVMIGIVGLSLTVGAIISAEEDNVERGASEVEQQIRVYSVEEGKMVASHIVARSDQEWQRQLTPEQFEVTRKHGTERAFSGALWDTKAEGVYRCVGCGNDLFLSTSKYDSGTGWPSFWAPVDEANIGTQKDRKLWTVRTEVHCRRCGAHLGHVFPDGPRPTRLRYCMNSASLQFKQMDLNSAER